MLVGFGRRAVLRTCPSSFSGCCAPGRKSNGPRPRRGRLVVYSARRSAGVGGGFVVGICEPWRRVKRFECTSRCTSRGIERRTRTRRSRRRTILCRSLIGGSSQRGLTVGKVRGAGGRSYTDVSPPVGGTTSLLTGDAGNGRECAHDADQALAGSCNSPLQRRADAPPGGKEQGAGGLRRAA